MVARKRRSLGATAALVALSALLVVLAWAPASASAHGSCSTVALEPTRGTDKIRGYADYACTEYHLYVNIQVCLQKRISGTWYDTGTCVINSVSSSAFVSGTATAPCTGNSHDGMYRTRGYGWVRNDANQVVHESRDVSPAKEFDC
jgi:hypothetical protein